MTGNKKIRLAALDLDRTALRSDKSLSERTERAIHRAAESGIEIVVASGRPYGALPDCIRRIPEIRYAITSNGAAVYELTHGTRIRECLLTETAVEQILNLLPATTILETFIQGQPYAEADFVKDPGRYGVGPGGIAYVQRTRTPIEGMRCFVREHGTELDSLDVITSGREETDALARTLEAAVEGIYLTTSVAHMLEISDSRCGKHESLRYLCDHLGIKPEETVAFGDADNDRQMLQLAGLGIAVANGDPEVKAIADRITASNDEDGVALVLEELAEQNS